MLVNKFGGMDKAGEALKSVSGWKENGNGTNSSGFNALPAGIRKNNSYELVGLFGFWSTSTLAGKGKGAWGWDMSYGGPKKLIKSKVFRYDGYGSAGDAVSVRCVRD